MESKSDVDQINEFWKMLQDRQIGVDKVVNC